MQKSPLASLSSAYRLINPGTVVLVSVGDGQADNLFAVAWNMPVRKDPPMVALLSGKQHHSYPFVAKTGEFALNVPDASIVDAVLTCGKVSGKDVADKFARAKLSRQQAAQIKAPLVAEAVANLECRICQVVDLGASSLILGQVLAAQASTEHFVDGAWTFDHGLKLLHHMGGGVFGVSERTIEAKVVE